MTDFVVSNITNKIDLSVFKGFVYNLPNIRKLSADLSNNQEVIKVTKNFYNATNCCNYVAFSDEKDVEHLPWHQFDSVFALEKKSFCCINQPAGMFTSPHY